MIPYSENSSNLYKKRSLQNIISIKYITNNTKIFFRYFELIFFLKLSKQIKKAKKNKTDNLFVLED